MDNQNKHRHTKYNFANIIRKIKSLLIDYLRIFINGKIKEIYNNDIGHGLYLKQLLRLNKCLVSHSTFAFNRILLKKTLLEIFSENITSKIKNYPPDKNKKLIEDLLNEKDDDKRNYFENLFNLTFSDCLEHFTTKRVIEELQGLKTFLDIKNDENELKRRGFEDKDYLYIFEDRLNNYEKYLNNKRKRTIYE